MSAVENVETRIARLQQTHDAKCAELRVLQTQQQYNSTLGIDEDLATGQSVAVLEVKVVGGRNMLYSSGFLSGKMTWQETLVFESVAHVGACLMVEVMQEERISATELDVELLQNQLRELHTFLERQRQFTNQAFSSSERYVPVNHLKGKEVSVQATAQRAHSTRFDAVATFPFQAARKREFIDVPMTSGEPIASDMHRAKRQRTSVSDPGPAPTPVTFTEKLTNWLLPSSSASPSPSVAPQPFGTIPVSQGQRNEYDVFDDRSRDRKEVPDSPPNARDEQRHQHCRNDAKRGDHAISTAAMTQSVVTTPSLVAAATITSSHSSNHAAMT
ncbi:hypothetical protein FI667_g11873, partial [Globisporangium splendens]